MNESATGGRRWVLRIPAPTVYVPARRSGQRRPPTGWPLRPVAGWLTMNTSHGGHWGPTARLRAQWRRITHETATVMRLPRGEVTRARFDAEFTFTRSVRRDNSNWHTTTKACIDALTQGTRTHPGYGFLPDDSPTYLHCTDCPHITFAAEQLQPKPAGPFGLLTLVITEIPLVEGTAA